MIKVLNLCETGSTSTVYGDQKQNLEMYFCFKIIHPSLISCNNQLEVDNSTLYTKITKITLSII